MSTRYRHSEELHARALRTIPLGSQTFSKSKTQFPVGAAPLFVKRGQGGRVWDVDGNEYVDMNNALAAVTLGYNDPDVNAAVREQLEDGVIFTLPHPIEIEVAEKLVELVPCAEQVRFGKNGSDATAGAIRLARAYTGRERVAVCGYHGWQDWYIGSTARHRGVPEAVRALTHPFMYNDMGSLEALLTAHEGEFAAVILEPMNVVAPAPGFLEGVQALSKRHGAVLIFDETVTGFRYAAGGAQEYFGVTPDLTTLGKGLANGFPLSAVVGRAEIMKLMEEIFFSFTFGGETLSLAASLATMTKIQREPVIETLHAQGQKVLDGVQSLIDKHGAGHVVGLSGHPAWSFAILKDSSEYSAFDLKTLYEQEMFARGVLTIGGHNMSYAHTDEDVAHVVKAYDEVLPLLRRAVDERCLHEMLQCAPLEPLFKIR